MKIIIFGTLPPPIGGVSIHVERFYNYCLNNSIDIAVIDIKKRKFLYKKDDLKEKILFFLKSNIWHIHISNDFVKIIIMVIGKILRKKIIYTHHNIRIKNNIVWKIINFFSDKIILVNKDDIKEYLLNNKTIEIPAFIPPVSTKKELPKSLNEKLKKFNYVISANCSHFTLINNKDLYGFDLLIEAFYRISNESKIKNTLLCLVDPTGTSKKLIETILYDKKFINGNEVLYIDQKIDFYLLIQESNLIIRPTRSDGDSITVREALYSNIPVICSDVVKRPKGVILFKNDDIDDLAQKIEKCINKKTYNKENFKHNFANDVINLYEEVLKKSLINNDKLNKSYRK